MGFKFGFDEDLETDNSMEINPVEDFMTRTGEVDAEHAPTTYQFADLLSKDIMYSFEKTEGLPRRDIFDARHELMQRDSLTPTEEILLGDTNEDIRVNQYEGGLKIWECSYDLISVFAEQNSTTTSQVKSCIELGCGAALPSAYLLQQALLNNTPLELVLADYNQSVLSLITAPNMFLTWYDTVKGGESAANEVEVSEQILNEFYQDLQARSIKISFISGAWSPEFVTLASSITTTSYDLVLASETIYSTETMPCFTDTMLNLQKLHAGCVSLVAAKKMYFGVGGNIADFCALLDNRAGASYTTVFDKPSGIGRSVLRIDYSVA